MEARGPRKEGRARALVVSEDPDTARRVAAWLTESGFVTTICPGPHVVARCPRLDGEPCPVREAAEVAVVEVQPEGTGELYGGWPERSCTKLPDDGGTVFVHTPDFDPGFLSRQMLVASSAVGVKVFGTQ